MKLKTNQCTEPVAPTTGRKIQAQLRRQNSLAAYYADPNYCQFCKKQIEVAPTQKVSAVRKQKYCNQSCAAQNQAGKRRKDPALRKARRPKTRWKPIRFKPAPWAAKCIDQAKDEVSPGLIHYDARRAYMRAGRPKKCLICDYDIHVEICHIKPVCTFPSYSLVCEINSQRNLVALCSNHHWELDHGVLSDKLVITTGAEK